MAMATFSPDWVIVEIVIGHLLDSKLMQ